MTIFLTSDNHWGHERIIDYSERPFSSVKEMDEAMIVNYNSVVKPKDIVYHLGDFSLSEQKTKEILPKLNGIIHFVPGNHDKCHPATNKKYEAAIKRYLSYGFASVNLELKLDNFILNHLPYSRDDEFKPRFLQYRPKDKGQWLLHGHVHNAWKIKQRMINVGVDVWDYKPVSLEQIKEEIEKWKLSNAE